MNRRLRILVAIIVGVCFLSACTSLAISEADNPAIISAEDHELKDACQTQQLAYATPQPLSEKVENNVSAVSESEVTEEKSVPQEHQIRDFPLIYQMPELPTGCEITAMTMVLHYYGYPVSKEVMASQYLPTVSANLHYGEDGYLYGNDLRKYFVGDPFSQSGYICGTEAILTASNGYLQNQNSSFQAIDKSGASAEELYELVSRDTPVMVWVTIGMEDRRTPEGWYTENGDYVDWSTNDHGAVLIGYTEDTVTIADPISGLIEYSRSQFERVFASRANQCVVLES